MGLIEQQSRLAHSYLLVQDSYVCHICSIDFKQESLLTANRVQHFNPMLELQIELNVLFLTVLTVLIWTIPTVGL